ncbi:MAG: carbohydrate porin [Nostoc sp. S4]|nr:carbohydrate porin [Nostoc sp. S4]
MKAALRQSTGAIGVRPVDMTPYHLKTFNYRVNDNISITLGVFWLFNPEGFSVKKLINKKYFTVDTQRSTVNSLLEFLRL